MLRPVASYRVLGSPPPRRTFPRPKLELEVEHQAWLVDTTSTSVAAFWLDGSLWLSGHDAYAIGSGTRARLPPSEASPPGLENPEPRSWVSLVPKPNIRYVVTAGAAQAPDPTRTDPTALLDQILDVPPPPKPGLLAKALGMQALPPEAAALIIDTTDEPPPADLPAWLADLQARTIDLSWVANESGPGLVHSFRAPMHDETNVRAALLDHAREDPELTALIREHAEIWLLDGGGEPVEEGRLIPDDPTRGWIEDLELDAVARCIGGRAGSWLDPYTRQARLAWDLVLPGEAVLASLRELVEQPTIVAVVSATEEPVLAVHLVGGIDRQSGELVGFALQRIWT
ncbi:hypothetical protein [Paraliomyxa miuraensis]|uniref:hypothetical protein n=1 Tax=Paraliomyxa miuraensis TaxID=376150 RepID=UPI00224F2760|nr:hypothetical protein [Paraliomyxa miuraensis]MCX4241179.1 hypothetical protein [Paraliomyxa miuraensis]